MNIKTIRIVKCSGQDREGLLPLRIAQLEANGFRVLFDDMYSDPSWPYCAATVSQRLTALTQALLEPESDAILWARGGYGASELLADIPWSVVKQAKNKPIIGFSDVCAAQSALYVMTGRPSIHGPMPASGLWSKNSADDVETLIQILKGTIVRGGFPISSMQKFDLIEGTVFGGCLSVLTSLIGTPYLPKSFKNFILLFEDVSENPGRVIRMLNQWKQSGAFAGVKAIVLGSFTDLGQNLPDNAPMLIEEIARRFDIPLFFNAPFGHVSPNFPFIVGSLGRIEKGEFKWSLESNQLC
ncbi:MAG: LD-carboxypeptidase [Proteobacteria bacterium]|nr:LD-carboxypeptidase [Pseudomonadota bacterium]